ncbi:immunity 8 family protein [Cupriavidus respiraculi]|uniref:immunity 8 family protein n=1 Tax=Cupriavidus respiraculi TaxID=195930 RepID=UPI001CC4AE04|nr:immunity 8 family protein [Cupriavidus respiraculi]
MAFERNEIGAPVFAVVKGITCDQSDLASYSPPDPTCFTLTLRVHIGLADTAGADDFECHVCTPTWLIQTVSGPTWVRHLMIVPEYDLGKIEGAIHGYVASCAGENWPNIASKLARVFAWEFEDYAP